VRDASDVEAMVLRIRLELYGDNIESALDIAETAQAAFPCPEYEQQVASCRWSSAPTSSCSPSPERAPRTRGPRVAPAAAPGQ
jgi:hypothetical protein